MATVPQQSHSFEEYLNLEASADYKSEFHAGEILAMSGGTLTHSRLSSRMNFVLASHLVGCQIFDSNLNVRIEAYDKGVYPDCMVICGEPQFWKARQDAIVNPTVVVEVLSPSTEDYDRGNKSHYYRSLPSLQHILLISADLILVEHLVRQSGNAWTITSYLHRTDRLMLLGSEIILEEIYKDIL